MIACTIPKARVACAICGGFDRTKVFGAWLIGQDMPMCYPCFDVWYDGGEVEADRIREKSLRAQGRDMTAFDPQI